MSLNIPDAKKALRALVRAEVKRLTSEARAELSVRAQNLLSGQLLWRNARSILFYAPLADELDLWPLLAEALGADKVVALPRFNTTTGGYVVCRIQNAPAEIATGRYGIREPMESCSPATGPFDLILVPGVAFDVSGGRVGRGAGFYDRLLSRITGPRCGVAFDEQIVDTVPSESHDLTMDYILTPTKWMKV